MRLSVVIPARNEEQVVGSTVRDIARTLRSRNIPFEIVVVNDGSSDDTSQAVLDAASEFPEIKLAVNDGPHGFGLAVRAGLERFTGDAVAVMMADGSDSPSDLVRYWEVIQNHDCAFGSRFISGGGVQDYPRHKLILNRFANLVIRILFGLAYNDVTNAFKCYRRTVIEGMQPLISPHFNLTVEMPLKAIVRGYSYSVVPISWKNRAAGVSKLKIKEMGSRYLFIILYLWLEKHLSRRDYYRRDPAESSHV
jgi:dolichol-phosphate mannosyltransferase